jgi:hypothetical protein
LIQAEELLRRTDLGAALDAYNAVETAGAEPDRCSAGRWMLAMLRGDFEGAWRESDAIRARGAHDPHRFWQGEDLIGKRVVLRCLHGFGDMAQFIRYMPMLRRRVGSVVLEVPPALLELAPMFAGVEQVISWEMCTPEWDVQIEINELPYIFRAQAHDLPIATNYLTVPAANGRGLEIKPRHSGDLAVGLVWASGEWNPSRSVPPHLLQDLLMTPGCEFWNLQGGSSRSQWSLFGTGAHLHEANECANSVTCLASIIAQLDLVITPDTLAAHLAGAMGIPCWVMLEYAADWRWQHARNDSPWYPSLRLFRQPQRHDWGSVVWQVRQELDLLRDRREHGWLVA